jgi:hypothetical protein
VIASAEIYLNMSPNIETYVNSKITIQDSITAPSFASGTSAAIYADFVGRARLATEILWDGITTGEVITKTKDFSSLIQGLVDSYGLIDNGSIVVFWGDREGRTPVPSATKANHLQASTYNYKLRIEFDSAAVLPTPHPSVYYTLKDINDARYIIDDDITNDARVLRVNVGTRIDYTVTPPVAVPVDFADIRQDAISQKKYGRRTWKHHWIGGHVDKAPTLCEKRLQRYKDPTPRMKVKVTPTTDTEMVIHLKTRISDKFITDIGVMGMSDHFWIDNKEMSLGEVVECTYDLTQILATENTPGVFEVDIDHVDDSEEVIA